MLCFDLYGANEIYRFFLIYRPPESSPIYSITANELYLRSITESIDNNFNANGPTIILGDLNCVNVDWATNRSLGGRIADILTDFVNSNGMTQCVNQSTHGPHILDLVLINEPTLLSSLFITAPFSTSDHSTVVFSLNFNNEFESFLPSILYNWRDANWADFIDYLYSIDWMLLLSECLTVDSLWASFCAVLNS